MKSLHVVALDVPYPPDYGAAIDTYYRLRALHAAGIAITLHCFSYGRGQAPELEQLCQKVYYYPRSRSLWPQFSALPWIVATRRPAALLRNLLADDAPILFDGLHTCSFLAAPQLAGRRKAVRMQNVEWRYYYHLARYPSAWWKRLYYWLESLKLRHYENVLRHADLLLTVTHGEQQYYRQRHANVHYLPVSHGHERVTSPTGKGAFVLYHGKLSVPENEEAARFIVKHFAGRSFPTLIIAGRDPSPGLQRLIARAPRARLVANPDATTLLSLMHEAHIHLLPTFQATGIKHKLLFALFTGRHVLANDTMVAGTGLESLCHVANTVEELSQKLLALMEQPFTKEAVQHREQLLSQEFNNQRNAEKLIQWLGL